MTLPDVFVGRLVSAGPRPISTFDRHPYRVTLAVHPSLGVLAGLGRPVLTRFDHAAARSMRLARRGVPTWRTPVHMRLRAYSQRPRSSRFTALTLGRHSTLARVCIDALVSAEVLDDGEQVLSVLEHALGDPHHPRLEISLGRADG